MSLPRPSGNRREGRAASEPTRAGGLNDSPPPSQIDGFSSLAALALDLRWSWNHGADAVWRQLDPALWELTRNPWVVLQTVSRERLQRLLSSPAFRQQVEALETAEKRRAEAPAWLQQTHPSGPLSCVAYFSLEFMLSEALPIYSGGLGNVAGDQLKAASDLGVPVAGVGLLYQQGYKRPNLLLHDPARLIRLLTNTQRPVQLIIAGKVHPADLPGQVLIQEWIRFVRQPEVRAHVAFLGDYDMRLGERLIEGVDVWINTPRRPWEACGTSGMKVLVNGGINLSELDGWWAEAYAPDLGWALGDGQEHDDDPAWDATEAEMLYDQLEHEVIPEFYSRDENGIPTAWVARMRESMARLTPQYCSSRSVREYTEEHYFPAAERYLERAANHSELGVQVMKWQRALDQQWAALRFGEVKVETDAEGHAFEVLVYLADLEPDTVRVELYADAIDGRGTVRQAMQRVREAMGTAGADAYRARVPASRPAAHYTPRVIPNFSGVAVPLEAARVLWQR